jgi:hypothetical protein
MFGSVGDESRQPGDEEFPVVPLGFARQRAAPDVGAFLITSNILPIVFGFLLLPASFGFGTLCTNTPGNGSLAESPCNRVDLGIKLGLVIQATIWLIAAGAAWRSRRTTWLTFVLVVGSVVGFVGSLIIAGSY